MNLDQAKIALAECQRDLLTSPATARATGVPQRLTSLITALEPRAQADRAQLRAGNEDLVLHLALQSAAVDLLKWAIARSDMCTGK